MSTFTLKYFIFHNNFTFHSREIPFEGISPKGFSVRTLLLNPRPPVTVPPSPKVLRPLSLSRLLLGDRRSPFRWPSPHSHTVLTTTSVTRTKASLVTSHVSSEGSALGAYRSYLHTRPPRTEGLKTLRGHVRFPHPKIRSFGHFLVSGRSVRTPPRPGRRDGGVDTVFNPTVPWSPPVGPLRRSPSKVVTCHDPGIGRVLRSLNSFKQ